jgi:hypothetical protein
MGFFCTSRIVFWYQRRNSFDFASLTAAPLAAILDLVPVFCPFFPPSEGTVANNAVFGRQLRLGAIFHTGSPLSISSEYITELRKVDELNR